MTQESILNGKKYLSTQPKYYGSPIIEGDAQFKTAENHITWDNPYSPNNDESWCSGIFKVKYLNEAFEEIREDTPNGFWAVIHDMVTYTVICRI